MITFQIYIIFRKTICWFDWWETNRKNVICIFYIFLSGICFVAPSYKWCMNSYAPFLAECTRGLRGEEWFVQKMLADGARFFLTTKKGSFFVFLYPSCADHACKKREGVAMQFFLRANEYDWVIFWRKRFFLMLTEYSCRKKNHLYLNH